MSDFLSYKSEPATSGKVILHTSVGPLDVELWSKECPLAVENFLRHALANYFHGCIFHRIVKNVLAQTGDPTNRGDGGESAVNDGQPFKNEIHSRLKFYRRGLLGMAGAGQAVTASAPSSSTTTAASSASSAVPSNRSQFFFTLGSCDFLSGHHTLFGKVVGDSLYNLLKLNDLELAPNSERPLFPPKLLSIEVILNPFPFLATELDRRRRAAEDAARHEEEERRRRTKEESKQRKNVNLLSFGEEQKEDDDRKEENVAKRQKKNDAAVEAVAPPSGVNSAKSFAEAMKAKMMSALTKTGTGTALPSAPSKSSPAPAPIGAAADSAPRAAADAEHSDSSDDESSSNSSKRRLTSSEKLQRLLSSKSSPAPALKSIRSAAFVAGAGHVSHDSQLLSASAQRRAAFLSRKKNQTAKEREEETLRKLNAFTQKIRKENSQDGADGDGDGHGDEMQTDNLSSLASHTLQSRLRPQDFDLLQAQGRQLLSDNLAASGNLSPTAVAAASDAALLRESTLDVFRGPGLRKRVDQEQAEALKYLWEESRIVVIDEREEKEKEKADKETKKEQEI